MTTIFGAQGVYPTSRGQPSTDFTLQPGQARLVPAGTWELILGSYSILQEYDPVQGNWSPNGGGVGTMAAPLYVNSDGNNYRVVNLSGCVVGAVVTTAGSGYTTAPTVTFSSGGAVV